MKSLDLGDVLGLSRSPGCNKILTLSYSYAVGYPNEIFGIDGQIYILRNAYAAIDPKSGIQVNYTQYWCAEFSDTSLHGKQVPVRYDPWDLSRAYAYVQHRWVLCRSEEADLYSRLTIREMHYATEEALFRLRTYEHVRQGNAANVAKGVRRANAREMVLAERRKAIDAQQTPGKTTQQTESKPVAQDDWSDAIEQQTTYGAF